jgi:hypothetical protein
MWLCFFLSHRRLPCYFSLYLCLLSCLCSSLSYCLLLYHLFSLSHCLLLCLCGEAELKRFQSLLSGSSCPSPHYSSITAWFITIVTITHPPSSGHLARSNEILPWQAGKITRFSFPLVEIGLIFFTINDFHHLYNFNCFNRWSFFKSLISLVHQCFARLQYKIIDIPP